MGPQECELVACCRTTGIRASSQTHLNHNTVVLVRGGILRKLFDGSNGAL